MSSEQIRNQHHNKFGKHRPAGQSSLMQFGQTSSAHMDGTLMGDEITQEEYEN
jgi:hypothetical protein